MSDEKKSGNPKVLTVHMAIGLDLIGSKTSLTNAKYDIEATAIGIKAVSRASGRVIVLPYSNVKGFELMPESGFVTNRTSASARADQALAEARAEITKRGGQIVAAPVVPVVSEAEQAEAAREARANARKVAREAGQKALEEQNKQAQK